MSRGICRYAGAAKDVAEQHLYIELQYQYDRLERVNGHGLQIYILNGMKQLGKIGGGWGLDKIME